MKKSELKSYIKENIIDILSEQEEERINPEDVKNQQDYNKELKKTVDLQKQLTKEDDEDDTDAVKGAMGARGKFKKLDLAVKALKDLETEMKSLARKYSAADETEKEKIKSILRVKTPKKKELEQLVAKLEKDAI
tara:strand:+ start:2623 stop:3027 length:405 start_codon:yes stop_codon:yes gene_type:complete